MNLDKVNGIGILCSFKAIPFRFWYLTTYNQDGGWEGGGTFSKKSYN